MEINHTLSRAQAEALFAAEAVFLYSADMIPEYRVIELFGDDIAKWLDSCCGYNGYMKGGQDYNYCGDYDSLIRSFYMPGFLKIVSKANHAQTLQSHRNSEAGKLADRLSEEREQKPQELDEEAERKRQKRKAKRTAPAASLC